MKYLLLLTFIAYIKSQSYYSSCKNPPKGRFGSIGSSECRKHNPSDGHCCLLYYYINNANHKKKSRYEECIGISKFGYDNIYSVEVDIEKNKNLDSVSIHCTSKMLDLLYISLLLFILIK